MWLTHYETSPLMLSFRVYDPPTVREVDDDRGPHDDGLYRAPPATRPVSARPAQPVAAHRAHGGSAAGVVRGQDLAHRDRPDLAAQPRRGGDVQGLRRPAGHHRGADGPGQGD